MKKAQTRFQRELFGYFNIGLELFPRRIAGYETRYTVRDTWFSRATFIEIGVYLSQERLSCSKPTRPDRKGAWEFKITGNSATF